MDLVKLRRLNYKEFPIKIIRAKSLVNREIVIKGECGTVVCWYDDNIIVNFENSCVFLTLKFNEVEVYYK